VESTNPSVRLGVLDILTLLLIHGGDGGLVVFVEWEISETLGRASSS
jgi:hypothetical protein